MKMGRLNNYLEKRGIEKKQIPSALLYLKGLSYLTWFGTLTLCYRYQPVRRFFALNGPKQFHEGLKIKYATQYQWCKTKIQEKSEQLANWRYFKPIPESIGLKSKRMTEALVENFVFYKMLLPIIFPLQFWMVMKSMSNRKHKIELIDVYSEVDQEMVDED